MPFASGSGLRVAYVAEVTEGTTPATPAFKTMRQTGGGGLRLDKATGRSEEVRADRNIADEYLLGLDASGDYNIEFSYGSYDDLLEAVLQGTWATNVLKNGTTYRSFTFEEQLAIGAGFAFERFRGVGINTWNMSLASRQAVTGSFGMMARDVALATTPISGATYAAASTTPCLTASAHIANISAIVAPPPKVQAFSFQVNNNLRNRPVVGSLYSQDLGSGRCDVTGSMTAYFESNDLYQEIIDHGGGVLDFTIGAQTLEKYTITFPNVIFLAGGKRVGGGDDDVTMEVNWRAVFDETEGCSIKVVRAVV